MILKKTEGVGENKKEMGVLDLGKKISEQA